MKTGIILDTCVVSEPARPRPNPGVRAWFDRQDPQRLFLTGTVLAEIAVGVERMPVGRRRSGHETWLRALVEQEFAGRILPFDAEAALIYGGMIASAYAQGRPPGVGDAQIAAVAAAKGMAVATRDIADFEPFGVELINPWASEPQR